MSAAAWGRETSSRSEKSKSSRNARLHVCNYELGIILVFPPPNNASKKLNNCSNLEDIKLPFVIPAPKYGPIDRPATKRAMWDVLKELSARGQTVDAELGGATEEIMEDEAVPDLEVDITEVLNFVVNEKEEEAAYADVLWSQVDSSQGC